MKQTNILLSRENIIRSIRDFFYSRSFHEIVIPVLNTAVPQEPNIYPFSTIWNKKGKKKVLYLSTSPERRLKQMIAQGYENCFGIGSSFRNLEDSGSLHTPEFLMLEWYCKNNSYLDIMTQTEQLLKTVQEKLAFSHCFFIDNTKPYKRLSLPSLFNHYLNIDFNDLLRKETILFRIADQKGYKTANSSWEELYNQLFANEIETRLPAEPLFLTDFPSRISPLCKPKENNPLLAERFELYVNKVEIANGNTENTDWTAIKNRFMIERKKHNSHQPIDSHFLNAIKKMHNTPYAGIGLGIDRLTLILSGENNLKDLQTLT